MSHNQKILPNTVSSNSIPTLSSNPPSDANFGVLDTNAKSIIIEFDSLQGTSAIADDPDVYLNQLKEIYTIRRDEIPKIYLWQNINPLIDRFG